MRSRGLVVVLAIILATLATVGVFLYSRGVKEDARQGSDLTTVVVSQVDIPANSDLNQFINEGRFTTLEVPADALVADAVQQISQLEGRRNSAFIFAGEQIPLGRVQGGEVPGGLLSIPEGHQAMTVALGAPRAISGTLAGGDRVSIFATFSGVELVKLNKKLEVVPGQSPDTLRFDTTIVLLPDVEVLRVIQQTNTDGTTSQIDAGSSLQVVLALTPEEAQRFVFALEQAPIYMSLLPPGEDGVDLDPITLGQVLLPPAASPNQNAGGEANEG